MTFVRSGCRLTSWPLAARAVCMCMWYLLGGFYTFLVAGVIQHKGQDISRKVATASAQADSHTTYVCEPAWSGQCHATPPLSCPCLTGIMISREPGSDSCPHAVYQRTLIGACDYFGELAGQNPAGCPTTASVAQASPIATRPRARALLRCTLHMQPATVGRAPDGASSAPAGDRGFCLRSGGLRACVQLARYRVQHLHQSRRVWSAGLATGMCMAAVPHGWRRTWFTSAWCVHMHTCQPGYTLGGVASGFRMSCGMR